MSFESVWLLKIILAYSNMGRTYGLRVFVTHYVVPAVEHTTSTLGVQDMFSDMISPRYLWLGTSDNIVHLLKGLDMQLFLSCRK